MSKLTVIVVTLIAGFGLTGCEPESDVKRAAKAAEKSNIATQQQVMARATASVPAPVVTNYQARKNLAEFMNRVDEPGKVW